MVKKHRQREPYLSKVPNVKQVEGIEQLTLFEIKLCLAHFQKCPDVLQAQELRTEWRQEERKRGSSASSAQ